METKFGLNRTAQKLLKFPTFDTAATKFFRWFLKHIVETIFIILKLLNYINQSEQVIEREDQQLENVVSSDLETSTTFTLPPSFLAFTHWWYMRGILGLSVLLSKDTSTCGLREPGDEPLTISGQLALLPEAFLHKPRGYIVMCQILTLQIFFLNPTKVMLCLDLNKLLLYITIATYLWFLPWGQTPGMLTTLSHIGHITTVVKESYRFLFFGQMVIWNGKQWHCTVALKAQHTLKKTHAYKGMWYSTNLKKSIVISLTDHELQSITTHAN